MDIYVSQSYGRHLAIGSIFTNYKLCEVKIGNLQKSYKELLLDGTQIQENSRYKWCRPFWGIFVTWGVTLEYPVMKQKKWVRHTKYYLAKCQVPHLFWMVNKFYWTQSEKANSAKTGFQVLTQSSKQHLIEQNNLSTYAVHCSIELHHSTVASHYTRALWINWY